MRPILPAMCLAVSLAASPALADDLFAVPTLSQAQALAAPESRLVVIYLSAERNDDCAFMEREAWTHPQVRAWMADNAVAAKVDVFSMHGAALRNRYQIEGAPAVLAFHGEELLRSQSGALSGAALLSWMQTAHQGLSAASDALAEAPSKARSTAPAIDFEGELQEALRITEPAAAARALVQLWELTSRGPQQEDRRPRIAAALSPHVKNSFQAAEQVRSARGNAWGRFERDGRLGDLIDWLALNNVLDESSASVRWAREQADSSCDAPVSQALGHPDDPLLPVLVRQRAFDVIGTCLSDTAAVIDARRATYRATHITITGSQREEDLDAHRASLAILSASLLVAGRNRDGKRAAEHILDVDTKAGTAIVRAALDVGEPRRWHRPMVDVADRRQLDLAIELATALKMR